MQNPPRWFDPPLAVSAHVVGLGAAAIAVAGWEQAGDGRGVYLGDGEGALVDTRTGEVCTGTRCAPFVENSRRSRVAADTAKDPTLGSR